MTLGDIIESIRALFGGEPAQVRKFRERVRAISESIRTQEDGLREVRKGNDALEERIAGLKRELKVESGVHNQDLLMDEIENLEKEFDRSRDLATLKNENLNAARVLRAKFEQLLEKARHGGSLAEIEDVMLKIADMNADTADYRKLVAELDRSSGVKRPARASAKASDEASARAARRARLLGEAAPAEAGAKPVAGRPERAAAGPAEPAPEPAPAPAAAPAEPGTVSAR